MYVRYVWNYRFRVPNSSLGVLDRPFCVPPVLEPIAETEMVTVHHGVVLNISHPNDQKICLLHNCDRRDV